jgi:hypothetical protein
MALNYSDFSQRALLLLAAGDPNSVWLGMETEAGVAQPQALQELGLDVANDPRRFGLLQQQYSVTLNSGTGNLASALGGITGLTDIIWSSIPKGNVLDTATSTPLVYVPNVADFEGYQLPGMLYYTIYQGGIYTRTAVGGYYNGDSSGVQGPLTVTANYYPSVGNLSTLPLELESDAIRYLARTLQLKYGPGIVDQAKAA